MPLHDHVISPGCLDARAKAAAPLRAMCRGMEGGFRVSRIGGVSEVVGFCEGS